MTVRPQLATLLASSDIISNVEVAVKAGKSHHEIRAMWPVDGYNMNRDGFVTQTVLSRRSTHFLGGK
jgi:hypothetical protein